MGTYDLFKHDVYVNHVMSMWNTNPGILVQPSNQCR